MLKYRGKRDVGLWLGRMTGKMIHECPSYGDIDAVVYVPLHPVKQRRRGYNQARVIAEGLLPYLSPHTKIVDDALLKTGVNTSQTSMTRRERLANVEEVYELGDPSKIRGRSVLLVDDVMTTGATVEITGNLLRKAGVAKLYVATAAVARM
jgi:ComF family protein